MFPTGNSSVIAGRASRLEWAAWTGRRPVPVHRSPILNGGHSRLSALQDLLAIEIAPISHYRQLLAADRVSCQFRHGTELRSVVADIGDLVSDNHVVLGIYGGLNVVPHDTRA